jgi:hypothetical protein
MDSYRSTVIERSTLTFCVEGLTPREELLFKAFVRLLDHQTYQQWLYHPPAANVRVDLLVVAQGCEPTCFTSPGLLPQTILQLGASGATGHGFLSWPLQPDALEKELNRIGGLVITQRGALEAAALPASLATGTTHLSGVHANSVRLQQWPPARLLAGPGRMRLATLLTGKAMNLDELVYRSALPVPVCAAFLDELKRAGLLVEPTVSIKPPAAPPLKPVQPGLLARIRMRLGIASDTR